MTFKPFYLPEKDTALSREDVFRQFNSYQQMGNTRFIGGVASFKNINVGTQTVTLTPSDAPRYQKVLDFLDQKGGGRILLSEGTFKVTGNLTGRSSITIEGQNPEDTVIDFGSTSATLAFTGSSVYTAGTITSITSGVLVAGSGTAWSTNVTAGQHLFVGTRWYEIASVTDDTNLVLSEGYGDTVTMPSTYRIATIQEWPVIKNVAFKNSTGTALSFTDARQVILEDVSFIDNNVGLSLTNCSRTSFERILSLSNDSHGVSFTNVGLSDIESLNSISNGGNGVHINNMKTASFFACSSTSNTGDGFNMTTAVDLVLLGEASSNGGQGIEMVSGCNGNSIYSALARSNTSDGIKLTATCDENIITTSSIKSNGGYGVNIAASSCDDNIVALNTILSNTSGQLNDSGTGTVVGLNVGV